jgi:hypothetical protein
MAPISCAAFSIASFRLPVMITVAPSSINSLAVARPIPLFPPVTMANLFSKFHFL